MQTHDCQRDITWPYGWFSLCFIISIQHGSPLSYLYEKNLDNKKKVTLVWITWILWIVLLWILLGKVVLALSMNSVTMNNVLENNVRINNAS